ncbi:response regulator transcription factor [Candidatus Gracilibacteria bacterium]|nr:response regulator transcription factor [Candidatus Gracilibacteria bacterium]
MERGKDLETPAMMLEHTTLVPRSATLLRIRIFLVDQHTLTRAGLRLLIESQQRFIVVGEAARCDIALRLIDECQPDVVVLDLNIGAEHALAILQEIHTSGKARVILLSALCDPELNRQAMRVGAAGLVQKAQEPEVLLRAIESVHSGDIWVERAMVSALLHELPNAESAQNVLGERQRIAALTQREREVIGLVGEGRKNRQIAERMLISETTVRHHLTSIFDKLGVSDRLELVIYAFKYGLARLPMHSIGGGRV